MYDTSKIIPGLAVFVGIVTFPFWYSARQAAARPAPNLDTPAIQQLAEKRCVEPAPQMRASHMDLLQAWRDQAVRSGIRIYVATDGRQYEISLQNTCLRCHSGGDPRAGSSQEGGAQNATPSRWREPQFCTTCHSYAGVTTDCWSCHIGDQEGSSR